MKLGILVNTDSYLDEVMGITKEAVSRGHEVIIFTMDAGTRFLQNSSFIDMSRWDGVTMTVCDHSAKNMDVNTENLYSEIALAGQFNNAEMNADADKVIVL
jgi:predicted peroxiredoxin